MKFCCSNLVSQQNVNMEGLFVKVPNVACIAANAVFLIHEHSVPRARVFTDEIKTILQLQFALWYMNIW